MNFDDCVFVDLTADSILSSRPQNGEEEEALSSLYPPYSSTATLQNSVFQNVVYKKWHALHNNYQQRMIVSQVQFDNVQFLPIDNIIILKQ
jgi:hypothetical protein